MSGQEQEHEKRSLDEVMDYRGGFEDAIEEVRQERGELQAV